MRENFQDKDTGISRQTLDMLNGDDPRLALAGDLFIASELKPYAAVLRGSADASPKLARAIFGYMSYLTANRKLKTPEHRERAIRKVLDFSANRETPAGATNTADPELDTVYDQFSRQKLHDAVGGHNAIRQIEAVWRARAAFDKSSDDVTVFLQTFTSAFDNTRDIDPTLFGVGNYDEMMTVAGALVVQSLYCPSLSSRMDIDDSGVRTSKVPDITKREEADEYVKTKVVEHYQQKLTQALKKKRDAEREERQLKLADRLIAADNIDEFTQLLESVDNSGKPLMLGREGLTWDMLNAALIDVACTVPIRLEKVWVVLLGRDKNEVPVWCQGNSLRADLSPYVPLYNDREAWETVKLTHKKYSLHMYRDAPNRHGHSNDLPSWWALGFSSLDAYQAADPVGAKKYIEIRLSQGRLWANPKYQKTITK